MILVISLKLRDFTVLKDSVCSLNPLWSVVTLETYFLADTEITRVAVLCNKIFEIQDVNCCIEAIIPDSNYCPECLKLNEFKKLTNSNRSGYCYTHRECDPNRKKYRHHRYKNKPN